MKKLLMILVSIFILTGCTSNTVVDDFYNQDIKYLESVNTSASNYDYDLNIYLEAVGDEYLYQMVLDNPKVDINNLKVLLIHDSLTDEIYPSYGYFGDDMDNTIPFKGLNLVGYLSTNKDKIEFKVLVIYDDVKNIHIITLNR